MDAEEVCVPTRQFTRGCENSAAHCFPRHDVVVTAFYVDRFQVTVRRYQECVDAGVCPPLQPFTHPGWPEVPFPDEDVTFDDLAPADPQVPVWTATHDQAETFCRWDGAELISGAQWERAALGFLESALLPGRNGREPFEDLGHRRRTIDYSVRVCAYDGCSLQVGLPPREPIAFDAGVRFDAPDQIGIENLFWFFEWTADTIDPYEVAGEPPVNPSSIGSMPYERRGGVAQFAPTAWEADIAVRDGTDRPDEFFDFKIMPLRAAFRCARAAEVGVER